jgi:copper chaperone CopZ
MDILVFKTNIAYKKNVAEVKPHLEAIPGVKRITFDLHDKDKVLRIEASNLTSTHIQTVVQRAGFYCEELTD